MQIMNRYRGANASPYSTLATMSKKSVSPSGEETFNGFFGETIGQKYLFHLLSAYGVKCLEKVYK